MKRFVACLVAFLAFAAAHAEEARLPLPSGENLAYSRYPGGGNELLLWFASEHGLSPTETRAARELAERGVEVWQFDLAASLFLPQTQSSMDSIDAEDMRAIFERARKTGARVEVYAVNRAAVPVLKGLAGACDRERMKVQLMHPHFYSRADAMMGADYLSFGDLSCVEALILQPRRSAATPWADNQLTALRQEGAQAELLILDGVREGFWVRETATEFEMVQGDRLAELLVEWGKIQ